MLTLSQLLIDFDDAHLRAIAWMRGVELQSNVRREMVDQLEAALRTPESISAAVRGLSAGERAALGALQSAGGRLRAHLFFHQFGPIRRLGPARLEREQPWLTPTGPAESLWYKGFLGRTFAREGDETPEFVFVPADVLPLLPDLTPAEGQEPIEGRPHSGEMGRLALIQHLCRQLGLLEARAGRLRLSSESARRWLNTPAPAQRRSLLDAWRADTEWNDLWRVPALHPDPAGWSNDPLRARQRFLERLGRWPAGEWGPIEALVEEVKAADPDFQRPDGDYNSWYIRDAAGGELLRGFEQGEAVESCSIGPPRCSIVSGFQTCARPTSAPPCRMRAPATRKRRLRCSASPRRGRASWPARTSRPRPRRPRRWRSMKT